MEFIIGSSYVFIFKISNSELTYTGKIISIDENFITFIDKYGEELCYSKSILLSSYLFSIKYK